MKYFKSLLLIAALLSTVAPAAIGDECNKNADCIVYGEQACCVRAVGVCSDPDREFTIYEGEYETIRALDCLNDYETIKPEWSQPSQW